MSVCPICQHDTKPFCDMCGYEPEALVNQRGEGIEQVEILLAELKAAVKNTETLLRRGAIMRCQELDQNEMRCVHSVGHVGYHLFVKPREQWPDERASDWKWEDKIIDAVHVEREACAKIAEESGVCACRDVIASNIRGKR